MSNSAEYLYEDGLYERLRTLDGAGTRPLAEDSVTIDPASRRRPTLITAPTLMSKVFPEPRWAVSGIFAEGLALLVGAPKLGKSWLALNVAAAVAHGGHALGTVPVDTGDVLYLALEDTQRRLQERLKLVLGDDVPSEHLQFATEWPTMADGGLEDLDTWLDEHPDARLVIVDTLQKLRGPIPGNQNLYAADYAAAGGLKQLADRHGVAVVVVHHTRKASAEDPLDTVSGTTGLAGAADTTCVLRREIGRADAALYVRGRDVPEADHALSFDTSTCIWRLLGDAAEYRQSEERQEIFDLIKGASSPMPPKEIADVLGKKGNNIRYLLSKMVEAGTLENVGGAYRIPRAPPNTANTANDYTAIDVPVSAVRTVREMPDQTVPVPADMFHGDLASEGVCEVCGSATAGEPLCWGCR